MSTIHQTRLKSNAFIASLPIILEKIANEIESTIVANNKKQFDSHIGFDGRPLIHKSTGSSNLSKPYAKRTGKTKPDINLTGAFRKDMFMIYDERKYEFGVSSMDEKIKYLPNNYSNMFGLVPNNLREIQLKAGLKLKEAYENYIK